jgi:23S rRNA pseudouridine2605 synthase
MLLRLQKRIADSGYCSRRKAESLIEAGKVKVNGKVITKLGSKVQASDKIEVAGTKLRFSEEHVTIMLNKPAGFITSKSDPHNKETVMHLLPKNFKHLKPAGRLDKESEGLLILSSDGELIQKLTHPKFEHNKTYEVLVKGHAEEANLKPLTSGRLKLEEYKLNPMEFRILKKTKDRKTWIELKLSEGRKRQIRRVMDKIGFPVLYLHRIKIGQLELGDLEKGAHKILNENEIEAALS